MRKTKRGNHLRKGLIQNFYTALQTDVLLRIHDVKVKFKRKTHNKKAELWLTKDNLTVSFVQQEGDDNSLSLHELHYQHNGKTETYSLDDCPPHMLALIQRINTVYSFSKIHVLVENTIFASKKLDNLVCMPTDTRLVQSAKLFDELAKTEGYAFKYNLYQGELTSDKSNYCRMLITVMPDLSIKLSYAAIDFLYIVSPTFIETGKAVDLITFIFESLYRFTGTNSPSSAVNLFNSLYFIYSRDLTDVADENKNNIVNQRIGKHLEKIVLENKQNDEKIIFESDVLTILVRDVENPTVSETYPYHEQEEMLVRYVQGGEVYESLFTTRGQRKEIITKLFNHLGYDEKMPVLQ